MAFCISSRPTPVASGEGVDRGQRGWVLLNNTNWPRKILVTKINDFIIVYTSYSTVIGHGISGKDILIMARLTKARRWSKQ